MIDFIQENYEPFRAGTKAFIPLDKPFDSHTADAIKGLFNHPEKRGLLDFIAQHDIIPEHLILAMHHKRRIEAINEFTRMLAEDRTEPLAEMVPEEQLGSRNRVRSCSG